MPNKIKKFSKKATIIFVALVTILWSIGLPWPVLTPSAQATSGSNIMYANDGGSSPDVFLDTSTTSELVLAIEAYESVGAANRITGITLTIRDTIGMGQSGQMTGFTKTDLTEVGLYQDTNGNNAFDSGTDTVIATSAPSAWTTSATSSWYYAFSNLNVSIPAVWTSNNANRVLVTAKAAATNLNASPLKGFEFYLGTGAITVSVASSTSLSNFPVGPMSFPAVWLGTEGTGSMGTPFVISEIQTAGASSTDEFVELYSRAAGPIDLAGYQIAFAASNTTSTTGVLTNWTATTSITATGAGTSTIPANGFLLITHTGYDGGTAANITYNNFNIQDSGFVALLSPSGATMDLVGYGTIASSTLAEGGNPVFPGPSANGSLERKAMADSTPTKMATGGVHAAKGNGQDTQNNAMDFVLQAVANPQNVASQIEMPGGGFGAGMTEVVINEVLYNTATSSAWIEIYNRSTATQTLSNYLVSINTTSTAANTYTIPDNAATQNFPSGGYMIIHWNQTGTNTTTTGSTVHLYTGAKNAISAVGGDVIIYSPAGVIKDYVQYGGPGKANESWAASFGQWMAGEYINNVLYGQSIGRRSLTGDDFNGSNDWQMFSSPTAGLPNMGSDSTAPTAVTNIVLADTDTAFAALDGRDITITWTPAPVVDPTFERYDVYLLLATTTLNTETHVPLVSLREGQYQGVSSTYTYTAPSFLMRDSANISLVTGSYKAYVVAVDRAGNRSGAAMSPIAALTEEVYLAGSDVVPPMIMHMSVWQAARGQNITLLTRAGDDRSLAGASPVQIVWATSTAPTNPNLGGVGASTTNCTTIESDFYRCNIAWSNSWATGTFLGYYLKATDAATVPNISYMSASPAADSSRNLTNVQQNPFIISIQATSTYTDVDVDADLGGYVYSSAGTPLKDAYVFVPGTAAGYATTSTDGSFSFSDNTFMPGSLPVVVFKSGYMELFSNAFKGENTLAYYLNTGFSSMKSGAPPAGGYMAMPEIIWTTPAPGSGGCPTTGFTVTLGFSKTMNANTIQDNNTADAGSNIYLTSNGQDRISGAVTYNANTLQAVFAVSSGTTLTAGMEYNLVVTQGVSDDSGNPIMGNQPNGSYVARFTTQGDMNTYMTQQGYGNMAQGYGQGGMMTPPYVKGTTPQPGSFNVSNNTAVIIEFSEPMDSTTINAVNFKLKPVTNQTTWSLGNQVSATTSLDQISQRIVTITPQQSLATTSSWYVIQVFGGAKSAQGIWLGNPNNAEFQTTVFYETSFQINTGNTSNDTTAPTVLGTSPRNNDGISNTSYVNVGIPAIEVGFSEPISPSTVNSQNIRLRAGSTAITGNVNYDPMSNTVRFSPINALSASNQYALTVATATADLAGNNLAAVYTLNFKTGSADTAAPEVLYANGDDYTMAVSFSEPMNTAERTDTTRWTTSVLNPANYYVNSANVPAGCVSNIWSCATTTAPYNTAGGNALSGITGLNFDYDEANNTVYIKGFQFRQGGANPTNFMVFVDSVIDKSNNIITDTGNRQGSANHRNASLGPLSQSSQSYGLLGPGGGGMMMMGPMGGGGMASGGGQAAGAPTMNMAKMGMMAAGAMPMNMTAGQTSSYFVDIPVVKQVVDDQLVVLTFPAGFDITNAVPDPYSPMNTDMNDRASGVITFDSTYDTDGVAVNTTARTITVKLAATGTTSSTLGPEGFRDFLHFNLKGIVNSSVPQEFGTSGYTVDIKTKSADGALMEAIQTMPFYLTQGGSNTLSGKIEIQTGNGASNIAIEGNESFTLFLGSPMTGPMETTITFADGQSSSTYSFTNLPSADFHLFTNPIVKLKQNGSTTASEFEGLTMPEPIWLAASSTKNFAFRKMDSTSGAALTVVLKGDFQTSNATDSVDIFAFSPTGGNRQKMGLSPNDNGATSTNGASYTLYLPSGQWQVGMAPAASMGPATGPISMRDWMSPPMQQVISDGTNVAPNSVTLNIGSQSQYQIKGQVLDGSGNGLADVEVFAYQPQGGYGNAHTKTDSTGIFTLKIGMLGAWAVNAAKPGMPPTREVTVVVQANSDMFDNNLTADVYFEGQTLSGVGLQYKINKPAYTISGKVLNSSDNPVASAPVWANKTAGFGHADTKTDSSGNYILYVDDGTWRVEADAPGIGWLQYSLPVTISGVSQSNINLRPTIGTNYYNITGTVTIGGANQTRIPVRASEYNTTGFYLGKEYFGSTNASGTYQISVPAGIYRVDTWTPAYGEVGRTDADDFANNPANTDVRLGNATATISVAAAAMKTVTVSFTNGSSTQTGFLNIEQVDMTGAYPKPTGIRKSINLTNLSTTTAIDLQQSNYYFFDVNVPGLGFFRPDAADRDPIKDCISVTTTNRTVNFTLPDLAGTSMITISGTVKDNSAVTLTDVWVWVGNPDTYYHQGSQSTNGSYSLNVPKLNSGNYYVGANKAGYNSPQPNSITGVTSTANNIITLRVAEYTMSGTIRNASGTAITSPGWIWAEEVTTREQTGAPLSTADGTYSLAVGQGTTWRVFAQADGYSEGRYASSTSGDRVTIDGNASGINITLSADANWISRTKAKSITPSQGGIIDDTTQSTSTLRSTGSGVKITVPPNALGSDSNAGNITINSTIQGSTNTRTPLDSFDIEATDNAGSAVTRFNDNIDLEKVYYKGDVDIMALSDKTTLKGLSFSYYDSSNKDWIQSPTVELAYYKTTSTTTEWSLYPATGTNSSLDTFIDQVLATGTPAITYNDYKLVLQTSIDHFTVYGATRDTDLVKPAPPTGAPTQTAGSGTSVTISWTATTLNEDGTAMTDLLGYQIYRSTDNTNFTQVSTTTASSTTSYADSTTASWTSYYYKVTAGDDGGNESAVASSTSVRVCSNQTVSNGSVSSACTITCNTGYTVSSHNCVTAETVTPGAGASYIYTPTPMPQTTNGQVTATTESGGKTTVTSAESTTASVELPANAISASTAVTVAPTAKTDATVATAIAAAPTGKTLVGNYVYNFTATAGTTAVSTFNQSVTLTFTYTDSQITGLNESTLKAYYWNTATSKWLVLSTSVNTVTNTLTCTTNHFTYFAIMGETTAVTTPTTPTATTTTPTTPVSQMTVAQLQAEITRIMALIVQLQAQLKELIAAPAVITGIPADFKFKLTLKPKQVSLDIKYLQIILNSNPDTKVAESGVGSSGRETNLFGDLTKAAVIKFQEKYASEILTPYGLTEGTGIVSVKTRLKLNQLLGK